MNIFALDRNIRTCARYHADQHVIKMILESALMLCTVVNLNGGIALYRSTHVKHPCTRWAGNSLSNWQWLCRLALALNDEYRYRFRTDSNHASVRVIRQLKPPEIEDQGLTEFVQAMPAVYKIPGDAVAAYRRFYIKDKVRFAKWTRRKPPRWFIEGCSSEGQSG